MAKCPHCLKRGEKIFTRSHGKSYCKFCGKPWILPKNSVTEKHRQAMMLGDREDVPV